MRALVWFRADLRTDDNRALCAACRATTRGVIGVFVLSPGQWREHDWADIKVEFLLRNVACLTERLKRLNIPLRIVRAAMFAEVPAALLKLARALACDELHFNREYEVHERRRDDAVTALFHRNHLRVVVHDDQTIVPPDAIRTNEGRFYTVFTPFKRAWLAHLTQHGGHAPVPAPRPLPELPCAPDALPEKIAGFDLRRGRPNLWPAGENVALRQLAAFITHRVADYRKLRDFPAIDGTSRLSPYLTLGVVSPRRCLAEAAEANRGRLVDGRAGPDTWISELVWREFYRHVLLGFPRISMGRAFKPETERLRWTNDRALFFAWAEGRTGYPIIDAAMHQLAQTGWMHNRLRMLAAMFLTKDLLLDWRWGEQHFMRQLIDGDLASNNGGWQWSASTGTDAVPYFRVFNPARQARKCDPQGAFIRAWVPELRDIATPALHDAALLDLAERKRRGYPTPICDHATARQRALDIFKSL